MARTCTYDAWNRLVKVTVAARETCPIPTIAGRLSGDRQQPNGHPERATDYYSAGHQVLDTRDHPHGAPTGWSPIILASSTLVGAVRRFAHRERHAPPNV